MADTAAETSSRATATASRAPSSNKSSNETFARAANTYSVDGMEIRITIDLCSSSCIALEHDLVARSRPHADVVPLPKPTTNNGLLIPARGAAGRGASSSCAAGERRHERPHLRCSVVQGAEEVDVHVVRARAMSRPWLSSVAAVVMSAGRIMAGVQWGYLCRRPQQLAPRRAGATPGRWTDMTLNLARLVSPLLCVSGDSRECSRRLAPPRRVSGSRGRCGWGGPA